jgi:hypothetical protein
MVTIHAQLVGDKVLLSRAALGQLLELARRSAAVEIRLEEEDWPTVGVMGLAEEGGAFDFWREQGEDAYSLDDDEPGGPLA